MGIISNFILFCFYQVLYMSIIATVIGAVTLLIKRGTKKRLSANANYLIWMVFLVALICPISFPSRISVYNFIDIEDVKKSGNSEVIHIGNLWKRENNDAIISKREIKENIDNNNKISKNYLNYLEIFIALIWFAVFSTKLIKTMFFYRALTNCVGNENVEEKRIVSILERCKERLKIKRNIKLVRQNMIEMPSTIGIFNVRILVTDAFLKLDDITITDVIMHELSHYKRKDNVVNFMMLILKSVHWFNPIIRIIFKNIRNEMEFATDEIAINNMGVEEQRNYCKVMIKISSMNSLEEEPVLLGLSTTAKTIEKRIEMISLKETFEENSKIIVIATIFIMTLMCLVFYPTSYAEFVIPKLYLKLENGDIVETVKIGEENDFGINEIRLTQDSEVSLVVKGGRANDYIFYDKVDLNTMKTSEKVANIVSGKIAYFESGEFIYNFVLTYGNNQMINYAIKIIVE